MMIERLSTGIEGLDAKMEGGLPRGSVTLVTGRTGTGKTAFCSSFLYSGAMKGEPGVYITAEERPEDIKGDIRVMFGWDFDTLERSNLLRFVAIKPALPGKVITGEELARLIKMYIFDLSQKIDTAVKETKAKRLVLDSVSIIEMFIKDEYMCRVAMIQLTEKLRELDVTSILTGTIPEASEALSGGGIVEFIVDAIIKLDFVPVAEEFKRTLTIRKMRRTDHSIFIHPFDFADTGLKIIEIK